MAIDAAYLPGLATHLKVPTSYRPGAACGVSCPDEDRLTEDRGRVNCRRRLAHQAYLCDTKPRGLWRYHETNGAWSLLVPARSGP